MTKRQPRLLAAIAALIVGLVACGDSSPTTTTPASVTSIPAVTTTAPAPGRSTTTTPGVTTTSSTATSTSTTLTPVTVTTATTTTQAPQPTVAIDVTVANGAVKGPGRVKVALGNLIVLTVTADVADEVHFHGYDRFGDVAPGQPAILRVEALIPGVFQVELEGARLELVVVEVK